MKVVCVFILCVCVCVCVLLGGVGDGRMLKFHCHMLFVWNIIFDNLIRWNVVRFFWGGGGLIWKLSSHGNMYLMLKSYKYRVICLNKYKCV